MRKCEFIKIIKELKAFLSDNGCEVSAGITNHLDTWKAKNNHTFIIDDDFNSKVFAIYHKNELRQKNNFLCWMDEPDLLIKAKSFILMQLF